MTIATDAQRLLAELERFRAALLEIAVKIEESERANAARFRALCDTAQLYGKEVLDRITEAELQAVIEKERRGWTE